MKTLKSQILEELKEHVPFTLLASFFSIIAISLLLLNKDFISNTASFFYIFHPAHLFFSSIASAAIFYNHKKKIILSIIIGAGISIAICSISDILFPYFGSLLFNIPISFHLPEIELPILVFGISLLGGITGVAFKKTKLPHFFHVFVSVFASLLYILAYSSNFSLSKMIIVFIITSFSVIIPCCLSDIILPLMFSKNKIKEMKK